jgi:hypothetical protein
MYPTVPVSHVNPSPWVGSTVTVDESTGVRR